MRPALPRPDHTALGRRVPDVLRRPMRVLVMDQALRKPRN